MFTGLIEEIGEVREVTELADSKQLKIYGPKVVSDIALGDSIQVSGVCLTAIDFDETTFTADVMLQTLQMSTLGELLVGSRVNLERATRADTRLGGHIVQGHVDGVGKLLSVQKTQNWRVLRFAVDQKISMMLVAQGSVTVAGVSLTVSNISEPTDETQWFEVSLIPETERATTLGELKEGERVNIETDIIARHVARMLNFRETKGVHA